jgi:hypothetical protein
VRARVAAADRRESSGLAVGGEAWTDWTLVDQHPHLVYRVRAHVARD